MNMTEQNYPGCGKWDGIYEPVQCLKRNGLQETWLLAERHGPGKCILKKAARSRDKVLLAEAELLKSLASRPQLLVPGCIDVWSDGRFSYLLREYVPGRTLEDLIEQEGPLTPEAAVSLTVRLCLHIRLLHGQDPPVIHRDIKPENIVVTETGNVRLIDFGTARTYDPGQEKDTLCMGTEGYAPPEQFGFGQTDVRSDIYAIGKVMLFMLTGGCTDEDLSSLSAAKRTAPVRMIRRCCAYEPARRYQNTDRLLHDLGKWEDISSKARCRLYVLSGLLAAACVALAGLGIQNYRLDRQLKAVLENDPSVPSAEYTDTASWNPYLFEEDISSILQFYQEGDNTGLAQECSTLIEKLYENEQIRQVIPIPYQQLNEEELADYRSRRMGYEYIADYLASDDYLVVDSLDRYEEYADRIAFAIRTCLEYSWTNEDGSQERSVLFSYSQGDDRNMDGCILDLISCIHQALE